MTIKKLIIGVLSAILIVASIPLTMEIQNNISEQACISGHDSDQIQNSLDGSDTEFILNAGFPEERSVIPSYEIINEIRGTEQIKKVAESFGLKGEAELYIKNTGENRITDDSYDPQRQISYYSKSGAIVYAIPDREFPESVEVQPDLPPREEAIKIAEEFLRKTNTFQNEAFVKDVEVSQKQQVWKSGSDKPERSCDITIAVHYARNLGGIPVYGDEFSVIIGDSGEVAGLVKTWRDVEEAGTIQLRPARDAYSDLCNQNTVNPANLGEYDTITINSISQGYWMKPRIYEQNKVIPIYVFSGTATRGEKRDPFTEYVHAAE